MRKGYANLCVTLQDQIKNVTQHLRMKKMASKTTRMQDTTIAKFDDIKKIFGVETNDDMMNGLIALIPLHIAMVEKGLTIEQAIEKLNAVETKTEVRIIKKGINEFAFNDWKEKLFAYNEKASNEDKVIITQNL